MGWKGNYKFNKKLLKSLREERGLSCSILAHELYKIQGVKLTEQSIFNHERGENVPNLNILMAYSKYFRVSLNDLIVER